MVKLFDLPVTFSHGFTHIMQTVRSDGHRDVVARVSFEEQTNVKIVIEVVVPALVKTRPHDFSFPEMTRLRSFVGPTQTVSGRLRNDGVNYVCLVPRAKHHCIAANPF